MTTTATAMKYLALRPQFAPLVMSGAKTQTRRVITPQPPEWIDSLHGNDLRGRAPYPIEDYETGNVLGYGFETEDCYWNCPYGQPGDQLCFLTTWGTTKNHDNKKPLDLPHNVNIWTAFDGPRPDWVHKLRPGRFMPLSLREDLPRFELLKVRVERAQEISEADAQAEGVESVSLEAMPRQAAWSCRQDFARIWQDINGPGSWESSPWVWALDFRRIEA